MIRRTNLMRAGFLLLAAVPLALQIAAEARQQPTAAAPGSPEYFETFVRPVLASNCYDCHADERMGGLRLDSREGLLKGGKSGPAIVPGDPEKSLMVQAIRQTRETLKMPKGGRLKPAEIEALAEWVKAGAFWPAFAQRRLAGKPADAATVASAGKPSTVAVSTPTASAPSYVITPAQRAFWSFQPLHATPVPVVSHASWAKTDIDRFVLARLEQAGLTPVRAADKRTLIRRATLDLTGLPPTPDEIDAFEQDARLTRSPTRSIGCWRRRATARPGAAGGWTSHVRRRRLPLARSGIQRGYNPYLNAALYRDWVIKAFNDDLPHDRFVRAQLAGDLVGEPATRFAPCPRSIPGSRAPGITDNGASRSTRAPTSATIASTSCRAASSGSRSAAPAATTTATIRFPRGTITPGRRVPQHLGTHEYPLVPKSVVDEHAAGQADREEGEAARRVHAHRVDAAERRRSPAGVEILRPPLGGCWASRRKTSRRSSTPRSWTTSCSIAGPFLVKPPRFYPY
jgi:mono/diheme cytochrome c family protein